MKYLKLFEENKVPSVGDWIIDVDYEIGIITTISREHYIIDYKGLYPTPTFIDHSDVLFFGSLEEVQKMLPILKDTKKYNL